jgi:N-acetylmuramoyl-L-alanine amidase
VMICEASTEGRIGMLAVANVVMNRVKHPRFPNTIEEVVYQRHQFECVQKGIQYGFKDYGFKQAYNMAINVIEGKSPKITNATHYFQYKLINPPFWATNDKYLGTIGNHKFYRVYN